ncbi:hypothetical protein KI387_040980, partial [Taxus chinensis]
PTFLPREESIPEIETQPSKVDNIATWYEEYRALPEKIRDAMSFAEFMGVSKGRSRPKPRSRATQEEKLGLQVMEKKQPIEESTMQVEEGEIMELEPKKEEKSDLQVGKEKLEVEAQLPNVNVEVQLAGNFRTTIYMKQVDDVYGLGENHEKVPCMHQQNVDEVEAKGTSLVVYEGFKLEELAPSFELPLTDFQNSTMKSHVIEENIGNHKDRRVG